MKFFSLLTFAVFAILPCAHAEDAPGSLPQPSLAATAPTNPGTPSPASPAPSATAPPAARKEEETETGAWSIKRLASYLKSKSTLSDAVTEKDNQITALQARITALENGTELKALRDEAAALRADLESFAQFAQTHGLLEESGTKAPAAPLSPMGKAAGAAVAGAVSTQLATLGVPAATLPPAAAAPGANAATLAELEEQLKACKSSAERQDLLAKNKEMILASN